MSTISKKKKRRARQSERRKRRRGRAEETPQKSAAREWFDSIVFVLVVMIIVRTFFVDMYRIPTPSMENSLLVGDYIFVSKLHYGTRTPMTIGVPFTRLHIEGLDLPWTRLPGFDDVDRFDEMVFNYPAQSQPPISRKSHYIKRVIGLPGDTINIRNKVVFANGNRLPFLTGMQQRWQVEKRDPRMQLPVQQLGTIGIDSVWATNNPAVVLINASARSAQQLEDLPSVSNVVPHVVPDNWGYQLFPVGRDYTRDNYGPVYIPHEGQTVTLTENNWTMYVPMIERYEGHDVERVGANRFRIDGELQNTYTFEQDYFFVMGDNRDNSEDSRFWGYVPMNHVVGKAVMVYFSWDAEEMLPRFGRIFHLL